ncbi:hypothetical protein T492DRAFT_543779 [Pavlovales sp. CCMP2436]|nr:hypothetical protein T492DRAFT_543779 [Pavlovales sp. CCMP2436]
MAAFEQAALQRELNREDATSSPVGTPELGRRRLGGGRRSASRAAEERREARSVTEATTALVKLDLDRTPRLAAAAAGAALCAELLGRLGQVRAFVFWELHVYCRRTQLVLPFFVCEAEPWLTRSCCAYATPGHALYIKLGCLRADGFYIRMTSIFTYE